ncbi:MAG: hypothetical protein NZ518_00655, partial [Dehalococcoidia bacterium]|nr:hypothetical protein [Dehalococcoidia bacterium]
IPRRATNLFYNVSTPQEWKAQWDALYANFVFPDGRTGAQFTYEDILDWQSDQLLMYLVKGEVYPWMFHQANMRAYAPGRTLITDLLDRVWAKYTAIYTLPILSPPMDAVGAELRARTSVAEGEVVAVLRPGLSISFTAQRDATVGVTGLRLTNAMNYGGQWISTVQAPRGRTVTVSLGGRTAQDMWAPGEEERAIFLPVVATFR